MIDARSLHGWLGVSDRFHQWVSRRVTEYGFEEGSDFCTNVCKTGGRPRTDYLLTVDMAKELSMVERTLLRTRDQIEGLPLRQRPAHHRDRRGTVVRGGYAVGWPQKPQDRVGR